MIKHSVGWANQFDQDWKTHDLTMAGRKYRVNQRRWNGRGECCGELGLVSSGSSVGPRVEAA